jgi:hypothetical protein
MKLYLVIFHRDTPGWKENRDFVIVGYADNVEDCKEQRSASGDIVVEAQSLNVVDSESWLFAWEKGKPSYAVQQIRTNGGYDLEEYYKSKSNRVLNTPTF